MVYDYDDPSEVSSLEDFKSDLIEDLFLSVFFQHKSDRVYNMLKLPIIIAPSLLKSQVNSDYTKKTLMEKEFTYTDETLDKFIRMVETKQIKINSIQDLATAELKEISKNLGIFDAKKSGELMKIDMVNLSKIFLGGQVRGAFISKNRTRTQSFQYRQEFDALHNFIEQSRSSRLQSP